MAKALFPGSQGPRSAPSFLGKLRDRREAVRRWAAARHSKFTGRRLLIQYAVGEIHERMLLMTAAHHKTYCNRWNAIYHNIDKRMPQHKRPHWQKVKLLCEALDHGYDQIMWLDADAVIVRPS